MNLRRTLAVARRIVQQFRRDPRTIAMVIVVPVVMMALIGYLLKSVEPERTVAISADLPTNTVGLAAAINAGGRVEAVVLPRGEALQQLRGGDVQAVLLIEPGPTGERVLTLLLEGTDPTSARVLEQAVRQVFAQQLLWAVTVGTNLAGEAGDGPQIAVSYLFGGPEYETADFFAPALIGFFAFFFIFLLTAVSFLRERTGGTLERLMAAPIRRSELVGGYILGFGLFALLQAAGVVLVAVYGLRIHHAGSIGWVFLVVFALSLLAVSLGIFLSAFARTELQAIQFIPIVLVPQALLSGIIWPVSSLPRALEITARLLPLTHAIDALRAVMLKGHGFADGDVLWPWLAVVAFAVAFVALAVTTLRRESA